MKASNFIKKLILISFILIGFIFTSACQNTAFLKNDFQEVNFTDGKNIQLVTGEGVYNIFVVFDENGNFSMEYLPEASEIYLNTKVTIKGGLAEITSASLRYSENINEFNDSFIPKIIYCFLESTCLEKENFTPDADGSSMTLTNLASGKDVTLTVRLTNDKQNQTYIIEIR